MWLPAWVAWSFPVFLGVALLGGFMLLGRLLRGVSDETKIRVGYLVAIAIGAVAVTVWNSSYATLGAVWGVAALSGVAVWAGLAHGWVHWFGQEST